MLTPAGPSPPIRRVVCLPRAARGYPSGWGDTGRAAVGGPVRSTQPLMTMTESEAAHFIWQYFAVTNNTDARKGGATNAVCMICDKASVDAAPYENFSLFQCC